MTLYFRTLYSPVPDAPRAGNAPLAALPFACALACRTATGRRCPSRRRRVACTLARICRAQNNPPTSSLSASRETQVRTSPPPPTQRRVRQVPQRRKSYVLRQLPRRLARRVPSRRAAHRRAAAQQLVVPHLRHRGGDAGHLKFGFPRSFFVVVTPAPGCFLGVVKNFIKARTRNEFLRTCTKLYRFSNYRSSN